MCQCGSWCLGVAVVAALGNSPAAVEADETDNGHVLVFVEAIAAVAAAVAAAAAAVAFVMVVVLE